MNLVERLREDLRSVRLRTLIAAIENDAAVVAESQIEPNIGLNHDRPRRELSNEDVVGVVATERIEIAGAISNYRGLGLAGALQLDERLAIIDRYIV